MGDQMKTIALAALFLAIGSGGAQAQWYEGEQTDNPFEKTQSHWVFSVKNTSVFGFACNGPSETKARLVFVTPERADPAEAGKFNVLAPQLAIMIDNDGRADLSAEIDTVDVSGTSRLRITAWGHDALALVEQIGAARRRVSVALSMAGKTWHATNFSVVGSSRVLRKAVGACGISAPGAPT